MCLLTFEKKKIEIACFARTFIDKGGGKVGRCWMNGTQAKQAAKLFLVVKKKANAAWKFYRSFSTFLVGWFPTSGFELLTFLVYLFTTFLQFREREKKPAGIVIQDEISLVVIVWNTDQTNPSDLSIYSPRVIAFPIGHTQRFAFKNREHSATVGGTRALIWAASPDFRERALFIRGHSVTVFHAFLFYQKGTSCAYPFKPTVFCSLGLLPTIYTNILNLIDIQEVLGPEYVPGNYKASEYVLIRVFK